MNTPCPMCDGMCCRTEIHRIPSPHASEGSHVCPGCQNGLAPLIDFKRLKAMFNELDTLHTEIGYALEGKEVPRGKDELLDRVIELANARHLDNEDLARAYDMGRDKERAAVAAWLREQVSSVTLYRVDDVSVDAASAGVAMLLTHLANIIERGDHRRDHRNEEKP